MIHKTQVSMWIPVKFSLEGLKEVRIMGDNIMGGADGVNNQLNLHALSTIGELHSRCWRSRND